MYWILTCTIISTAYKKSELLIPIMVYAIAMNDDMQLTYASTMWLVS